MDAIQTAGDAIRIFNNGSRKGLIEYARYLARQYLRVHGTIHSRIVRKLCSDAGVLPDNIDDRWLGAVFHSKLFVYTGKDFQYEDRARNCHVGRTTKIWTEHPAVAQEVLFCPPKPSYLAPTVTIDDRKLAEAEAEIVRLKEENARLMALLDAATAPIPASNEPVSAGAFLAL